MSTNQSPESEIRDLVIEQVELFSRGEWDDMPVHTFQAPVWVGSDPARLLQSSDDVARFFERLITAIREKGYSHSEVLDVSVTMMSPASAIGHLTYRRYRADGSVFGPDESRTDYLTLKTEGGWRFTALLPIRR